MVALLFIFFRKWNLFSNYFSNRTRGGQKLVKTDPPDKTARPVRPAARPWVIYGRITDIIIFLIRVSGGLRVLSFLSGGYPPARPVIFKEKKTPNPHFPISPSDHSLSLSFRSPSPRQPNLHATTPSKPQRRNTHHTAAPPPAPHLQAVAPPHLRYSQISLEAANVQIWS